MYIGNKNKTIMFVLQMIFAYPDTLVNMTVEVMGVYVSGFMERLVTYPSHQRGPDGNYQHYQEPCRRLEEYINGYVPYSLANDVTIRLMRHIDVTYTKLMKNEGLKSACAEIAPVVLKSVIHNTVKTIDCIHDTWHPTLLDYYKITDCELLYRTLPFLEDMKELKLGRMDRIETMSMEVGGFTKTLEKFSCRTFRMHDLETLSNNCKEIRSLDIGGSAFYSAKIFNHMFQFKNLEKLNLSLLAALSKDELHRTVNWMAGKLRFRTNSQAGSSGTLSRSEICSEESRGCYLSRPEQLKFFGCVNPEKQIIPTIASFSNLNSLVLSYLQIGSLTSLSVLKQLQNLTLIESRFSLAEDFLRISGYKLKCFNVINCSGTDFKFISENCRALECLHLQFKLKEYLHFPFQYRRYESDQQPTPPDFPKVTRLQLRIPDPEAVIYITKSLLNVKKLSLFPAFNDDFIFEEIFERRFWRGLEEFYWGNKIVLKFNGNVITVNEFHADGSTSVHHVTYQ